MDGETGPLALCTLKDVGGGWGGRVGCTTEGVGLVGARSAGRGGGGGEEGRTRWWWWRGAIRYGDRRSRGGQQGSRRGGQPTGRQEKEINQLSMTPKNKKNNNPSSFSHAIFSSFVLDSDRPPRPSIYTPLLPSHYPSTDVPCLAAPRSSRSTAAPISRASLAVVFGLWVEACERRTGPGTGRDEAHIPSVEIVVGKLHPRGIAAHGGQCGCVVRCQPLGFERSTRQARSAPRAPPPLSQPPRFQAKPHTISYRPRS